MAAARPGRTHPGGPTRPDSASIVPGVALGHGHSWLHRGVEHGMDRVEVVGDGDLRDAVGTPGIVRRVAFEDDESWFGHVMAEPETMSAWHHHGDNVTVGHVVSGRARIEFGPGGREAVDVEAGQYFRAPANTVHREGNAEAEPGEVVAGPRRPRSARVPRSSCSSTTTGEVASGTRSGTSGAWAGTSRTSPVTRWRPGCRPGTGTTRRTGTTTSGDREVGPGAGRRGSAGPARRSDPRFGAGGLG